ncbi:hypothetical protein BJY52DRAFT_1227339 [Lactarius psammicola]|nr:hypothetical protein BJY52DRAFT_1227339 [Lactarius psammicola]
MCLLLQKLCVELLYEIVSCLPPHDIRACRQTCKRFSDLIEGSPLLQYMISRANSCVVDVPSLVAPIDSRLDALRRWERAWERLSVHTLERDLRGPGDEVTHYAIRDGSLIGIDKSRTPGYYYRPICASPPSSPHDDERGWTRVDFPSRGSLLAVVFAMEYEMTAVISYPDRSVGETMAHLRLLDFRTGEAHPLAANPTLPIMTLDVLDTGLQVQAEFLRNGNAILMQMSTIQDWNAHDVAFCQWYLTEWKTGRTIRIKHKGGDATDQSPYGQSFAVVAPDIIAVLQPRPDALVLCRVPCADDADPTLTPLCQLALPALRSGLRHLPARFDTDGTGIGTCRPGRHGAGGGYRRLPFANDTAQDVMRLTMIVTTMDGYRGVRWSIALSRKALLLATTGASGVMIPWGEWGSRAAYVFQEEFGWGQVKCAGQRWVWLVADAGSGSGSESSTLFVRDFNVFRAKRAQSEIAEGNGPSAPSDRHDAALGATTVAVRRGDSTSSVLVSAYFAEDVASELPYCETATQAHTGLFRPCRQILTDGEHLLGFVCEPVDLAVNVFFLDPYVQYLATAPRARVASRSYDTHKGRVLAHPLTCGLNYLGGMGKGGHANTMQTQAAGKAVSGNGNPEPHWVVMNCEPFPPALTEEIGRIARCSMRAYMYRLDCLREIELGTQIYRR